MNIFNIFKKKQVLEDVDDTSYLKVEFMTQEEKVKKDIALQKVSQMYQSIEEDQVIVNKDNQYRASFRKTFQFKSRSKIRISELLQIFQGGVEYPDVYDFMNTEVESIQLFMYNKKSIQPDNFIFLLDIQEQLDNDENKVLEIIYKRTSIFKRIKIGVKKAVVSLPRLIFNLLLKLIQYILRLLGLNSVYGVGFKVAKTLVGPKAILTSLLGIISVFFPILTPFAFFSRMF